MFTHLPCSISLFYISIVGLSIIGVFLKTTQASYRAIVEKLCKMVFPDELKVNNFLNLKKKISNHFSDKLKVNNVLKID